MEPERLEPLDAARLALAWERARRIEAELAHAKSEMTHLMAELSDKHALSPTDAIGVDGVIKRDEAPPPAPPHGANGEAGKAASPS